MSTLRVREIIEGMDSQSRAALKKNLPPKLKCPDAETQKYPSAIMSCFTEDPYANLGRLAETLLRLPVAHINLEHVFASMRLLVSGFQTTHEVKITKSKTTQPFLDCLIATRQQLDKVLRAADGDLRFEETITQGSVEGHPDMRNKTQIFEIKLTGMLKKNWPSFLLQVFAYGAIAAETTDLYLVLPLQKSVWHYDIKAWKKRKDFLEALQAWSTKTQTVSVPQMMMGRIIALNHNIGSHMHKAKTLKETVESLPSSSMPYQIFLGGAQTTKMNIKDEDVAAALDIITKRNLTVFIHAQYLINLSAASDEDWAVKLLAKNLQHGRAFGAKGVVVHVGKSVKQDTQVALDTMRSSIERVLEYATPECPLLLETPAGQGTELLTESAAFLDFVESFKHPGFGICVDTCHVFASGHNPHEYITEALARPGLLKLVHFNDSLDEHGSCLDRHAFIGTGKIGLEVMGQVAELCTNNKIPMVIE
jgi:deoxyribonuclease-4